MNKVLSCFFGIAKGTTAVITCDMSMQDYPGFKTGVRVVLVVRRLTAG